jgi:D-3-phosphoglycerate dehydrogenase
VVLEETAPPRAGVGGRPKVVIYDPVSWSIPEWSYETERATLETHGVELVVPKDEADSDAQIVDADVVVVTAIRGQLNAAGIATLTKAVGLVCASIGMNQVDLVAAAERNIPVRNVPFCVDEVSDHALTLLLMAERRIPRIAQRTADGQWDFGQQPEYWQIRRLKGRTLGIIGVGRIGREIARKAQAFGYRTIGYDPNVSDPGNPLIQMLPLATVMAESDAIVTAADLNPTSRNIIGRESLSHVRPGTLLVNIARGGLVDEAALADAIRDGRISIAALDVRAPEPPKPDNDPLAGLPNLILTPHMAGASVEARESLHQMTADVTLGLLAAAGRLATAG